MKIEFDTGNEMELLAVATLIEVLSGRDSPAVPLTTERHSLETVEVPGPGVVAVSDAGVISATVPPPPPAVTVAPGVPPMTVAIPTPPTLPSNLDLDTQGLPWDNRIHSTPATKNADGSWRSRRNLDPDVKEQVTAELKRALAAPLAEPAAPTPPAPARSSARRRPWPPSAWPAAFRW